MDCLKNLTACVGCTRKHAKCAWREVKAEELEVENAQGGGDQSQYQGTHVRGRTDHGNGENLEQPMEELQRLDSREENRRVRQDIGVLLEPVTSQEGMQSQFEHAPDQERLRI